MRLTVEGDDGTPVDFECADTTVSRAVSTAILAGKTYPFLPFVDDVRVVFDVGADCGAATVHFARHYPDAEVHSFEPASDSRAFLERNAGAYANVHVHPGELRAGGAWAAEHGITRIDVLKVGAEPGAADVIESLTGLLPTVKVLFAEYGSRQMRRELARLVEPTLELYVGVMFLDQGKCSYLNCELVDLDAANDHLRQAFAGGRATRAT